jgi:hypothetical protein
MRKLQGVGAHITAAAMDDDGLSLAHLGVIEQICQAVTATTGIDAASR